MKKELLIITHEVFEPISKESIRAVLSEEELKFEPIYLSLDTVKVPYGQTKDFHWRSAMAEQRKWFEDEETQEKINHAKSVGNPILYFGKAPIPLAVHLGYLFNSWSAVRIYLWHPDKKDWSWPSKDSKEITISPFLERKITATGSIAIRLRTSFPIEEANTLKVISDPLDSIDFYANELGRDIIGSHETIDFYGTEFRKVLDHYITSFFPNVEAIHLFAAIPVGLAFRIGQCISNNFNPKVFVYEYFRNEPIPYLETFYVQEKTTVDLTLTEEEEEVIQGWKESINNKLQASNSELRKFIRNLNKEDEASNWLEQIKLNDRNFANDYWRNLTKITETGLEGSKVLTESYQEANAPFYKNGEWIFPDLFLKGLMDRLGKKPGKKEFTYKAAYLYFFAEMAHYVTHKISKDNTLQLARYPQILAEADYQADVFALLHLYTMENPEASETKQLFMDMIDALTETMWAVDTLEEQDEIEVRRLNRYLTWYYQRAQIESDKCKTLKDIFKILSRKPLIELKLQGLSTIDRTQVMFNLKKPDTRDLGIAIFEHNYINESQSSLNVANLIKGFYKRNPELIKETLSAFILTK